jgi:hypothetical protein
MTNIKRGNMIVESKFIGPTYWYHGRNNKSTSFSYDYVGRESANDNEGPGFYFTSDLNDSKQYAHPNGIILKCKISYNRLIIKTKTTHTKTDKKIILDLILNSPDKDYTLMNFDENPRSALKKAIDAYVFYPEAYESYQTIWRDFYRSAPAKYLRVLSKYFDGQLTERQNLWHLVIYKPELITVVEKINL